MTLILRTNLMANYLFGTVVVLLLLFSSCQNENSSSTSVSNTDTSTESVLFTSIDRVTSGIQFKNTISETTFENYFSYAYFYNGGGVALGDINNDGLIDIYFSGNQVSNKLYLNKGNFVFEDVTAQSGTGVSDRWSTGVSMVDINTDGWLDIYVCVAGKPENSDKQKNLLFINQKDGTFKEESQTYGLADPGFSTQAYFWDFDKDNDVDIYVVNHRIDFHNNTKIDSKIARDIRPETSDQLYRNDNGQFTNITQQAGIPNKAWGLSASIADFNGDEWPDIYIANDFLEPDMLYLNQKNGSFIEASKVLFKHISFYGMGSDVGDINNDGLMDLYVVDMVSEDHVRSKRNMASMSNENFWKMVSVGFHRQYMLNTLQLNNGAGSYSEIGSMAGISKTDWSWAPLIADFDQDGYQDIFVSNGIKRDVTDNDFKINANKVLTSGESLTLDKAFSMMESAKISNYAFRNSGDLTFKKVQRRWGLDESLNSNGAMYADLDNDGDQDLVVNNIDAPASIYKNNSQKKKPLQFNLIGPEKNPHGIGASVIARGSNETFIRTVYPCRGFMSSAVGNIIIPVGDAKIQSIEIKWNDGISQQLENFEPGEVITLNYANASSQLSDNAFDHLFAKPKDNLGLNYVASENLHDDFIREILLPHKQSQMGPAMTAGDLNGDQLDDIFFGGPFGKTRGLFIQTSTSQFEAMDMENKGLNKEDVAACLFDADNDGDQDIYVVCGGSELPPNSPDYQDELLINNGSGGFKASRGLPPMPFSGRCATAGDYDGDGDMDLFIGGSSKPQNYPEAERSFILQNNQGKFQDVTPDFLKYPGIVSTALWHDIDDDGDLDLIYSGEWMDVFLSVNEQGKLTESISLTESSGWFFNLQVLDIDGDGKQDIVAGNIGLNNKFQPKPNRPLHLYLNDFDNNGTKDIVLSKDKGDHKLPVRGRECSSQQMPFISEKFPTYKSFAEADLTDIYGDQLDDALHLQAHNFAHLALMQKDDGSFQTQQLPIDVQRAPIMGFEKIQLEDKTYFIYAGNFHPAEVETVRYDAGIGGLLTYENGSFQAIPAQQSGLYLDGDVRELETIKLANGQLAIIAACNNSTPQVFLSQKIK